MDKAAKGATPSQAPVHCEAMNESEGKQAIDGKFFDHVAAAMAYFDRLVEPRVVAAGVHVVTISHVQSGLGNRRLFSFCLTCDGHADAFVDQIAQRAIEGRGREC